jgi:TolB-like protein
MFALVAILVGLNGHGWRDRLFPQAPKLRIQALAVLPLANLSGDPHQEYFADGMTEALITELGKISAPRVISRQSVMQYKGGRKPLQEIARELTVDAVLEGAVERSGDHVRVSIHLDQVSPESQLWAKQYNRDIRDVMRLQDEIARTVTDETIPGSTNFSKRPQQVSPTKVVIMCVLPKVKAAAIKALELDPSLGEAHLSLAQIAELFDWNWSEADKEYRLALTLNPNLANAHLYYGRYLQALGRDSEVFSQIDYAIELDPFNLSSRYVAAYVTYASRQYDLARGRENLPPSLILFILRG